MKSRPTTNGSSTTRVRGRHGAKRPSNGGGRRASGGGLMTRARRSVRKAADAAMGATRTAIDTLSP